MRYHQFLLYWNYTREGTIRVAINGFGRIGRAACKIIFNKYHDSLEVVAINDLADAETLAFLLRFDSNYGHWHTHEVLAKDGVIYIDQKKISVYSEKEPDKLPWKDLNVDIVIEATGKFTSKEGAEKHLLAGANYVIISAPAKGDGPIPTQVIGVNKWDGTNKIISNASCTTNCITPMIHVLQKEFGVKQALMTTIHAYTQDQSLQDGPHKDLRRARSAAENIIPTTTGAALATTEVITELQKKFDGISIRVPVPVGSLSDITAILEKDVSVDEINEAFRRASKDPQYRGVLAVTNEPIVSSDIVGSINSAIVDLSLTMAIGSLVKVFGWYDNEWAYANRLVEQIVDVSLKS